MHGDSLFHKKILEKMIKSKGDICLAIQEKDKREMIRVKTKNELITQITKPIPFDEAYGNFIGIVKYSSEIGKTVTEVTDNYIKKGKTDVYFTEPINQLIQKGVEVYPISVGNLPWLDVDNKKDLKIAEKNIKWIIN